MCVTCTVGFDAATAAAAASSFWKFLAASSAAAFPFEFTRFTCQPICVVCNYTYKQCVVFNVQYEVCVECRRVQKLIRLKVRRVFFHTEPIYEREGYGGPRPALPSGRHQPPPGHWPLLSPSRIYLPPIIPSQTVSWGVDWKTSI